MKITYDGLTNPSNTITITQVPNILTIESDGVQGSKAELHITIGDLSSINLDKDYYITINGVTINSTTGRARNKYFYITNSSSQNDKNAVAASIVRTLRNTSLVNYEIYQGNSNGIINNTVVIQAREVGEQYNIKYSTNLGLSISTLNFVGSTTDEFAGNKICVDVYSLDDYITTLEKNYYKDRIDFNLSLVLTSMSRYDYLTPYKLSIYKDTGTSVSSLAVLDNLHSAVGYMTNQGDKYIKLDSNKLALNVKRGSQEGVYNKTVLYTFNASIPVSIYSLGSSVVVEIAYLDSDKGVLRLDAVPINVYNNYGYSEIALNSDVFNISSFIDLKIPDVGTIRYNVIKPIDATSRCQRVYYHNSYGGVSFFDFTGQITENHKVDNDTYTKNIFDYYDLVSMELLKVYNKETSIVVTMKSHLMERSAVWQFNDLLGSFDVWTIINGVQYKIIVTDCKVDETETGVWEATVSYTYSLI